MTTLKIQPLAVDQTGDFYFNTVTANNLLVNTVNVYDSIIGANANIALLFSVNDYQNTTITNVNTYATSAYGQANIATTLAQAAFNYANTLVSDTQIDPFARANANAALATANTASANTIYIQGIDDTQNTRLSIIETVNLTQNTNITAADVKAQAAFDKANTGVTTSIDQYARDTANLATANIVVIQGTNVTQNTNIVAADAKAQAAFNTANTKFNSSGGTISGDTVVSGNLTVTGTTFYANTVNLNIEDNIITLNSNVTGVPTSNAGIEINRGSLANTKLLWSEANNAWEFTNNGITYDRIASQTYANAAYAASNTNTTNIGFVNTFAGSAFANANAALAIANSAQANTIYTQGVDTTQNTNISLLQGAMTSANANIVQIFGITLGQNAFSQAAFNTANTASANTIYLQGVASGQNTFIQAAFNRANTGISDSIDLIARANANAALATANSAQANTIYTQGVNDTQNTNITLAYGQANIATTLAQAAFNYANTIQGGGGSGTFTGGLVTGNTIFAGTLQANGAVRIANTSGNVVYTLPNYDGVTGQSLITDGYGRLQWTTLTAINGTGGGTSTGFPYVDLGFVWENPSVLLDMGTLT